MMLKNTIFWFLLLTAGIGYAQTSIRRIDSLINVAKSLNDVDSSSRILATIKQESEEIDYKGGMASYVLIEGVNLFNRGKFDEGLKFTYQGEKLVLNTGDNAKISHLYALRGNCYNALFFFEKSQECLLEAKQYAEKIKDDNSRYNNLGRIYKIMAANFNKNPKIKNVDSVIFYHKKSYQIQSKITGNGVNQSGVIIQAAGIGLAFLQAGKSDSARHYFEKSIALAEKNNLSKFAVEALIGLGNIHFNEGHSDIALKYYLRALSFVQKTKSASNMKLVYEALAKTYKKLGDNNTSIEYYQKYAEAVEKIAQANKTAITIPIDYIIKERENLLEKENELRNSYFAFTICVSILSILIVIILYKNISTSRKNNRALNRINKQMVSQNEYLQNTLEALEQSNEKNKRMTQIIAHDLRSPMAAIVGISSLMIDDNNLMEEDLEMVKLIHTSGEDSLKFISEILQKESTSTILKKEPIDLHQLLSYCTTQLQYKAKEKNQLITLNSSPLTIPVNREKIWRVISNLVTNAIKFSPTGSTISVTLNVEIDRAVIAVKDAGIGIPDNLKDKIFNKSEESKRLGTSGEKSFGLGLAISKEIIEEHGGTLSFESHINVGTTFFISLPLT